MSSDGLKEILGALRGQMKGATPTEFDQMLDAQQALIQWGEGGFQGEIPYKAALDGWGIEIEETHPEGANEAPSPLTIGAVEALQQRLRDLLIEGHPNQDEVKNVYHALRRWQDEGMPGPLPHQEQMQAWGTWPLGEAAPVATVQSNGPSVSLPTRGSGASTPPPSDHLPSDDPHQREYEDARAALKEDDFYRAEQLLEGLKKGLEQLPTPSRAHELLLTTVRAALLEASSKLEEVSKPLITAAKQAEDRHPNDLPRRERAWNDVLARNPKSPQAAEGLARVTRDRMDRETEATFTRLRGALDQAVADLHLPNLNAVRGEVSSLKARGERVPPELSTTFYQKVVAFEKELLEKLYGVREALGQTSTLIHGGYHRNGYVDARTFLDKRVPKMIDKAGIFGPAGEEFDTSEFYVRARELFMASTRGLVAQRRDAASGVKDSDPTNALSILQNALALLEDEVWTADDKAELKSDSDLVLRDVEEVKKLVKSYNEAKAKADEALLEQTPRPEALSLLRAAREAYPNYPNIDERIREAEASVANIQATEVANALPKARGMMAQDRFQEALAHLATVRTQAAERVPHPQPDSAMVSELARLAALEQEIVEAQQRHGQMMALLAKVDGAIARFDGGEQRALDTARNLLEQFSPEEKRHHEVRERQSQLLDRQGDVANWEVGQQSYRMREWSDAVKALSKVAAGTSTQNAEASALAGRARAAELVAEAEQAERERRWKDAQSKYEQAQALLKTVGTDELTSALPAKCSEGLKRLEPLQANDEKVSALLNEARILFSSAESERDQRTYLLQKIRPIEAFKKAAEALTKAAAIESSLKDQVDELLQKVRYAWRTAYISAMTDAASSSDGTVVEAACKLADELRQANLFFSMEDELLARQLDIAALDAEYQRLYREPARNWEKLEANRKKRYDIHQARTDEVEQQYREAVRQRILSQVEQVQLKGLGGGRTDLPANGEDQLHEGALAAKSYLAEQVQRTDLPPDVQLVTRLIELCWQTDDWLGAERWASLLGRFGSELPKVWAGLTKAARWFRTGQILQGRTELKALRDALANRSPELPALIAEKEESFLRQTLERLLNQAQRAQELDTPQGYLEAASLYAQAEELSPRDLRVGSGLQAVGAKLGRGVNALCSQANSMKLGTRPLNIVVSDAVRLAATLEALQRVASKLELEGDLPSEITFALQDLAPKRDRWIAVNDGLERAKQLQQDAMQKPVPIHQDEEGTGGWNFSEVRQALDEVQQAAWGDNECSQLIETQQARLARLETVGQELTELVRKWLAALQDDDFDQFLALSRELAEKWRQARLGGTWAGLETLIRVHDQWHGREVSNLDEHRKLTEERRANLKLWEGWSESVQASYSVASEIGEAVTRRAPEVLRRQYPLVQLIEMCKQCQEAADTLEERLSKPPRVNPLSRKAETARNLIPTEEWRKEISGPDGFAPRAALLQKQFEADLGKVAAQMERLQKSVQQLELFVQRNPKKPIHVTLRTDANKELRAAMQLDPQNEAVKRARTKLENLKALDP